MLKKKTANDLILPELLWQLRAIPPHPSHVTALVCVYKSYKAHIHSVYWHVLCCYCYIFAEDLSTLCSLYYTLEGLYLHDNSCWGVICNAPWMLFIMLLCILSCYAALLQHGASLSSRTILDHQVEPYVTWQCQVLFTDQLLLLEFSVPVVSIYDFCEKCVTPVNQTHFPHTGLKIGPIKQISTKPSVGGSCVSRAFTIRAAYVIDCEV